MQSNYVSALAWLFGLIAIGFALLFRRRLRQWLAKHGIRHTGVSAGNAFLTVQSIAQPRVEYAIRAQQEERTRKTTREILPTRRITACRLNSRRIDR